MEVLIQLTKTIRYSSSRETIRITKIPRGIAGYPITTHKTHYNPTLSQPLIQEDPIQNHFFSLFRLCLYSSLFWLISAWAAKKQALAKKQISIEEEKQNKEAKKQITKQAKRKTTTHSPPFYNTCCMIVSKGGRRGL